MMEYNERVVLETDIDYLNHKAYLEPKLRYLDACYKNKRTIMTYWGLLKRFVLPVELDLRKDLYEFSAEEIKDMIMSIPTTSLRIKGSLARLCSLYIDWALQIAKYKQGINPFININIKEITQINKRGLKDEYVSIDRLLEMCDYAKEKNVSYRSIVIVLLARLGIYGEAAKYLLNLRIQHVNINNDFIRIIDEETGEIVNKIHVDNNKIFEYISLATQEYSFIQEVKKKKSKSDTDENSNETTIKEFMFYDNEDRIIKGNKKDGSLCMSVLYKSVREIFEINNMKALTFKKLVRSAMIDYVNEKLKENGYICIDDFKSTMSKYSPESSASSYFNLMSDYKLMFPDVEIHAKPQD